MKTTNEHTNKTASPPSGNPILEGVRQAVAYSRGENVTVRKHGVSVPDIDVRAVREDLGLTQEEFAIQYGFPLGSVQNWEQRRREPELAAKILLHIIWKKPQVVANVLQELR